MHGTQAYTHPQGISIKALFMKGNVCMGIVLSVVQQQQNGPSRFAREKESESNEKRGVAAARVVQ